jgi:hypothetical protein
MMTPNVPVSGNRARALAALLTSPSIAAAARAAGLGEKTIDRYLRTPGFRAALRDAQRRVFENSLGALQAGLAEAVMTLGTTIASTAAPPAVRVGAAAALVDMALRATEAVEIAERVRALEAAAPATHTGNGQLPWSPRTSAPGSPGWNGRRRHVCRRSMSWARLCRTRRKLRFVDRNEVFV